MIWLDITGKNGNAFYLDVHHMESRMMAGERGLALSATVGDGGCETQVLIEAGEGVEVTFADRWCDREAFGAFSSSVELSMVEEALKEVVADMAICIESLPGTAGSVRREVFRYRSWGRPAGFPSGVAEDSGAYRQVS